MTQRITITIPAQTISFEVPTDPDVQAQIDGLDDRVTALEEVAPPMPPDEGVSASDVMFGFDPGIDLPRQSPILGYESAGKNLKSTDAPATVISYNGSPRISLVPDPVNPSRRVLRISQEPSDPEIAGQPRCELNYERGAPTSTPPHGVVFWRVWEWYCRDWRSTQATTLVAQLHNDNGKNPFAAQSIMDAQWRTELRAKSNATGGQQVNVYSSKHGPAVKEGVWVTHVQKMLIQPEGGGFFYYWIDGVQKVNYSGKFGYFNGTDFVKQGLYPLDSPVGQETFIRGPYFVRDNGKYTVEDLTAFIRGK